MYGSHPRNLCPDGIQPRIDVRQLDPGICFVMIGEDKIELVSKLVKL
jgi:hypothetical protein